MTDRRTEVIAKVAGFALIRIEENLQYGVGWMFGCRLPGGIIRLVA